MPPRRLIHVVPRRRVAMPARAAFDLYFEARDAHVTRPYEDAAARIYTCAQRAFAPRRRLLHFIRLIFAARSN